MSELDFKSLDSLMGGVLRGSGELFRSVGQPALLLAALWKSHAFENIVTLLLAHGADPLFTAYPHESPLLIHLLDSAPEKRQESRINDHVGCDILHRLLCSDTYRPLLRVAESMDKWSNLSKSFANTSLRITP